MFFNLAWMFAGVSLGIALQWWREKSLRRSVYRLALLGSQFEADNESLKRENAALRRQVAQQFAPYVRVERGH